MKVLVASKTHENIDELSQLMPPFVTITGEVSTYEDLKSQILLHRPDVLLFNMNMAQDFIADPLPDVPYILAAADVPNPEYLRLGVEIKARDLLIKPFNVERLNDAVNKAMNHLEKEKRDKRKNEEASKVQDSRIISFFSTQGGVGQTTMAVNLAIDLKRVTNGSVVVVDANHLFGSVPIMLDLYYENSMTDIVTQGAQSDIDVIESCLVQHSSGIKVLPGPQEDISIKVEDVVTIVNTLKTHYNYVILDLKKMFIEQTIDILDISSIIVVLMPLSIPSIRNTNISLNKMRALYYSPEKIKIVVNNVYSGGDIEIKDVEAHLNWSVSLMIPESQDVVLKSINEGKPFILSQPGSNIAAAVREMTYTVEPSFRQQEKKVVRSQPGAEDKKGLLSWLKK